MVCCGSATIYFVQGALSSIFVRSKLPFSFLTHPLLAPPVGISWPYKLPWQQRSFVRSFVQLRTWIVFSDESFAWCLRRGSRFPFWREVQRLSFPPNQSKSRWHVAFFNQLFCNTLLLCTRPQFSKIDWITALFPRARWLVESIRLDFDVSFCFE